MALRMEGRMTEREKDLRRIIRDVLSDVCEGSLKAFRKELAQRMSEE